MPPLARLVTPVLLAVCFTSLPARSQPADGHTHVDEAGSLAKTATGVRGARVNCSGGTAAGFPCRRVDLLSFLPVAQLGGGPGMRVNDLWGWTDPETGKEYALVGRSDGMAVVDVSDPLVPVYVGEVPTAASHASVWRDVKVYDHYALIVADGVEDHGMQVVDLAQLRSITVPPQVLQVTARYDGFGPAHNVVVNEDTGFAYAVGTPTCGGGLHMIDLHDPTAPVFAGCFAHAGTGQRRTGYTHDAQCVVYHGPDAAYQGREVCFGSNETALSIADVTDRQHPLALSAAGYPNASYTHQGWLTDDQRYFFLDDELDETSNLTGGRTHTLVWDVQDLDDPVLLTDYYGTTSATDHNQYVKGDLLYQANYAAGLRILDVSDPAAPREVGYFDTVVGNDDRGFNGAWSNYPFFESGIVLVTSQHEGLFVVQPTSFEQTQLDDFTASVDGHDVVVTWHTGSEVLNAGFEVQRAALAAGASEAAQIADARWVTVGTVLPKDERGDGDVYTFVVGDVDPGTYAFRVKQIDVDGAFRYSGVIVAIVVDGAFELQDAFPNPTTGTLHLALAVSQKQTLRVTLYDVLGRRIGLLYEGVMTPNLRHVLSLDVPPGVGSGTYVVRFEGDTFATSRAFSLIR